MQHIKRILLITVACFSFALSFAEDGGVNRGNVSHTVWLYQRTPPIRPGAPSNLSLECSIGDGFIVFDIPEGIEYITFSLYDNEGMVFTSHVVPEQPYAHLPALSGTYALVCEFDDGRVLSGEVTF